jgi:hypothetical protein
MDGEKPVILAGRKTIEKRKAPVSRSPSGEAGI